MLMNAHAPVGAQRHPAKDYSLCIARNRSEIEALRPLWEDFQQRPNSDIDHFLHVIEEDHSVIRPHVTLLRRANVPVALAVGRIENYRLSCKFGYKTVYSPRVRTLGIIYDGLLGDFAIENCTIILDSLLQTMWLEKLDVMRFTYLRTNSPMYTLLRNYPRVLSRDYLRSPSLHWRMDIPDDIEEFYRSRTRKHRNWMRKIQQQLEAEFPGQVVYRTYTDIQGHDEFIANAEIIARKTYQWGLGQAFKDTPEMRKRLAAFAARGQLRAYILYIKSEPQAFWLGRSYRNAFYLFTTGYNPDYKRYDLGLILFIYMLRDLAENTDIDYLDFGFSDQPYKSRFGNAHWEEEDVHIFSSSWAGLKLNMIRTIVGFSWTFTMNVIIKLGIKERIKRLMRNRLINKLRRGNP